MIVNIHYRQPTGEDWVDVHKDFDPTHLPRLGDRVQRHMEMWSVSAVVWHWHDTGPLDPPEATVTLTPLT
jgi:hypothetical protein